MCSSSKRWQIVSSSCACKELHDPDGYVWPTSLWNSTHLLPCRGELNGLIQRRCGVNGKWEARTVGCTEKTCPAVQERHLSFPATPLHTVVTVPCPVPYEGTVQRVCGAEEKWGPISDHCSPPTCHDMIISRNHHGCVTVDALQRVAGEQVTVMVLPSLTSTHAVLNATLPASICDLVVNTPYELWIQRYRSTSIRPHICVLNNIYSYQQCETMPAPVLQNRVNNADGTAVVRVLVTVPFCFDQAIQFVQVKLECVNHCKEAHPKILKHICSETHPCTPGNYLSLTSHPNLRASGTYHASARAVPFETSYGVASAWSAITRIEEGYVYIAESPLFEISTKDKTYFAYTEAEKTEILQKIGGKKCTIARSKGLGENDPEMMWMTTMNPETRRLIKVMPEDAERTAYYFDLLLGDNLAGRKEHIAEHGYEFLDLADIS